MPGKVWLVGAGPGDPGLITARGIEVLSQADVVLHDALSHPALLELCPNAEVRDVGKRFGERYSARQDSITEQLIASARAGKRVVRLKGGDPFMFARGSEEAEELARAGIPFEVVPGISAPVAASAYAGISLTHRDLSSSVTFITGSDRAGKEWSPEAWKKLATATDTICVLMGMRRIEEITGAIIEGGRAGTTPAAVIQWGARPEQRVLVSTLEQIATETRAAGLTNPAVILIGDVVKLREEIRWFDTQPLFGKRLLLPRPQAQARGSAGAIRARGAEPVVFPVIEIVDPPDPERLARAARELGTYDWVLFTSANGVERLFSALDELELDARAFGGARVGVIGPKTAESLRQRGLRPDVVADEFVGEGLARAVLARGAGRRVLLARALEARDTLPELLRRAGAEVDVVAAYRTRGVDAERGRAFAELIETGKVDVILFTSSSTVDSVVSLLGERAHELLTRVALASIGPITSRTLSVHGLHAQVTAERYTVEGLLDALEHHFA
ncbi:MAG TPA: uroporphyrinogen-III C-methyltransferase [Polyangiaceae bacterium]